MPRYINPNTYPVHLKGQDGSVFVLNSGQSADLDVYYDQYVRRGFIRRIDISPKSIELKRPTPKIEVNVFKPSQEKKKSINTAHKISQNSERRQKIRRESAAMFLTNNNRKDVGRPILVEASAILQKNLDVGFPISNNIGVGILSYNRPDSLKRLVDSIIKHTNLAKTTVFISDDHSTNPDLMIYLDQLKSRYDLVIITNEANIGVAGNSNRLLRCLSRFKYGIILNDDVEILNDDWEHFYVKHCATTSMHHFLYQQDGVYGSTKGRVFKKDHKSPTLLKTDTKPHGAVLFFTNHMLNTCGYFDEAYGPYGLEHVDWSMKPAEFGLQPIGFYDVEGSDQYFKIHPDNTSIPDKSEHLKLARNLFGARLPKAKQKPSINTLVPDITFVVPFRQNDIRQDSLSTVLNGIRAQRFPVIHMILIEQDINTKINVDNLKPIQYALATHQDPKFNKSRAFNYGVRLSDTSKIILHDADMLVNGCYTNTIANILDTHDGCHIGGTVIYTTKETAAEINSRGAVDRTDKFHRVVGYYEGGSLACKRTTYWEIGGFNEDFRGWGCEDCDFYTRISSIPSWFGTRTFDLVHMWHTSGVNQDEHSKNLAIIRKLDLMPMCDRIKSQVQQSKDNGYQ